MNVLQRYKKVAEEVACTSDVENEKYGTGIIHLDYNLNDLSVKKEYEGTATIIEDAEGQPIGSFENQSVFYGILYDIISSYIKCKSMKIHENQSNPLETDGY